MNKYQEALTGVQIIPQRVVVICEKDQILMERYYFELQDLVDKENPENVIPSGNFQRMSELYNCPKCGKNLGTYMNSRNKKYCDDCGQRLEWNVGVK